VGTVTRDGTSARVVAAAAIEMGMPASAALVTKLVMQYRPRFLAMAGIAAGVDLNFGDIIVAEQCWDYGSGKLKTTAEGSSHFAPAPNYIPLEAGMKERLDYFLTHRKHLVAGIQSRWLGNPVGHALRAVSGPVASGAAVVENEAAINAIREHNRKVIGVEMEIYASYLAAKVAPDPRPRTFAAKSVCDFGKPPKTDEYQRYAAFTSAQFVFEFYFDQLAGWA
jgi:nucleoside phosphorylase